MSKRKYTHIKRLLPVIQAMVEQSVTQREITEYCGVDSKLVVKKLLERSRKKQRTQQKTEEENRPKH